MFYAFKFARYAVAVIGGYFLANGDLDANQLDTALGAVATIISVVTSVMQSRARIKRDT